MSWLSEKEEDKAFYSLSERQKCLYFKLYKENGGNVSAALDDVLGYVWFNPDGSPKGEAGGDRRR